MSRKPQRRRVTDERPIRIPLAQDCSGVSALSPRFDPAIALAQSDLAPLEPAIGFLHGRWSFPSYFNGLGRYGQHPIALGNQDLGPAVIPGRKLPKL